MDEAVIKYYRRLLRNGFTNAGSLENPSIFLDAVGENLPVCGQLGRDYLHIFANVVGGVIVDIRYLCTCDPTANVVIEILCDLVKGKTIAEAESITPELFIQKSGSSSEELIKKTRLSIELLKRGLKRYQDKIS